MKTELLVEYFNVFKKQYENLNLDISFEDFDKYFYVENYFMNRKIAYFEKNFYVILLQIISETLKYQIHDLEYCVNVRASTPMTISDFEILEKNEEILIMYFKTHILYKKSNLLYMESKYNTEKVLELFDEVYKNTINYFELNCKVLPKLIENLEKKMKEVGKEKERLDSSIFH
ncbi:MAG: hypothetical protein KC589_09475 [Nanoarchaeota archaeon]|nr:hypothetical protein [Nanoarchaeota archaeon]